MRGDGMSELLISRHDRVLQLTLNRPQARNALNNAPLTQIADALESAAADASISVCGISGNPRFSPPGPIQRNGGKDLPATSTMFVLACGTY